MSAVRGKFLTYAIPGIPYGCNFALMAVGLVLTFRATGVFNLAFGAQAFVSAFIYALLVAHAWAWPAFVLSVLVLAPALGLALDRLLFRHIPSSTTAKIVSSLGLAHRHPRAAPIFFGPPPRRPPDLLLNPNHVYLHLWSTPINGGELATIVVTVVAVAAVVVLLRWTGIGLQMRAAVESRRMLQLEGVNARPGGGGGVGVVQRDGRPGRGAAAPALRAAAHRTTFGILLGGRHHRRGAGSMRSSPSPWPAASAWAWSRLLAGLLLPRSVWQTGLLPAFPFVMLVDAPAQPRHAPAGRVADPLAAVDPPPPPPITATRARPRSTGSSSGAAGCSWSWRSCLGPHVGAGQLGHGLATGPEPVDHLPVHHPDHRHGRPALAVPGRLRRGRRLRRRAAGRALGLPGARGGRVAGLLAAVIGAVAAVPAIRLSGCRWPW